MPKEINFTAGNSGKLGLGRRQALENNMGR